MTSEGDVHPYTLKRLFHIIMFAVRGIVCSCLIVVVMGCIENAVTALGVADIATVSKEQRGSEQEVELE